MIDVHSLLGADNELIDRIYTGAAIVVRAACAVTERNIARLRVFAYIGCKAGTSGRHLMWSWEGGI